MATITRTIGPTVVRAGETLTMAATHVFNIGSVPISAAPPIAFLPTAAGVAIPAGKTSWLLALDLGGTVPSGQPFAIAIEYQRGAWTDANGVNHPSGEWLQDTAAVLATGSFTNRQGVVTSVNTLGSSIGAATVGGGMVEPYPTHARVRIDQAGNWTLPNVQLTLN